LKGTQLIFKNLMWHINCVQTRQFADVTGGGTHSNNCSLKG